MDEEKREQELDFSFLDIPEDDFTESDAEETAEISRGQDKSIDDTLSSPSNAKQHKKATRAVRRALALPAVYFTLRSWKTRGYNKAFVRQTKDVEKRKARLENSGTTTFGDVFASALRKYNYQDKALELERLKAKLAKRQTFDRKIADAITGLRGASADGSRIMGFKSTADAILTAKSDGASSSDIPVAGRREVPDVSRNTDSDGLQFG
jgi:hypothetical protein